MESGIWNLKFGIWNLEFLVPQPAQPVTKAERNEMSTGLILVDIQNDYFPDGRMELVGMTEASSKAKDLLSLFKKKK